MWKNNIIYQLIKVNSKKVKLNTVYFLLFGPFMRKNIFDIPVITYYRAIFKRKLNSTKYVPSYWME